MREAATSVCPHPKSASGVPNGEYAWERDLAPLLPALVRVRDAKGERADEACIVPTNHDITG
jgi:hypothetical protein